MEGALESSESDSEKTPFGMRLDEAIGVGSAREILGEDAARKTVDWLNENDERHAQARAKFRTVDPYKGASFTVGDLGSLAETMGPDEAKAFLDEHSQTRHQQREALKRRVRPPIRNTKIKF